MHPVRKQRLIIVLLILFGSGTAVALMSYALRENINLFYPPVDVAAGKAPIDKKIRIGGMVQEGSVNRIPGDMRVAFEITDYEANVPVTYEGILPDLFAEGDGVVAAGKLNEEGVFVASEVLAKHDENYMPPEVKAAMGDKHPPVGSKAAAKKAAEAEQSEVLLKNDT